MKSRFLIYFTGSLFLCTLVLLVFLICNPIYTTLINAKITGGYVNCMPTITTEQPSFHSANQGIVEGEMDHHINNRNNELCLKARQWGIRIAQ